MAKSKHKFKKSQVREARRFAEYFISGGVWFWSGYIIIVFSYEHIGLFWANFIGQAVGITLNFILERYWVFKTKRPAKLAIATQRYIIYTALNAFLLNYLILQGLEGVGIKPAIGQFIASGFFTVWNYIWYKAWVFKGLENQEGRATMPEKRPTKKQYELLKYIQNFIAEHGYGPSYREIMTGCNYSSVATVAAHIKNLELAGHLVKKGRSARSLELVESELSGTSRVRSNIIAPSEEKWLVDKIDYKFTSAESSNPSTKEIDELYVLVGALKVLGLDGAAQSFIARLSELKSKV